MKKIILAVVLLVKETRSLKEGDSTEEKISNIKTIEEKNTSTPVIITIAREYGSDGRYIGKLVAEKLGIKVEVAHRALDDVDTTVKVFNVMMEMLKEKGAKTLQDLEDITDAGSCCGSCKNEESDIGVEKMELYLEDILKKFS